LGEDQWEKGRQKDKMVVGKCDQGACIKINDETH
jgi:hypothetical protein